MTRFSSKHIAVFVSNAYNISEIAASILSEKKLYPFHHLKNKKGLLFSSKILTEFLEEEEIHGNSALSIQTKRSTRSLSSGEQRKALLQHLINQKADYIILENPFDHLDVASQEALKAFLLIQSERIVFIQLLSRKDDLLSLIKNELYTVENNQINPVNNLQEFLNLPNESNTVLKSLPNPIEKVLLENDELVYFNKVSVVFNEKKILNNIVWKIKRNEFWQLIGPNGSGKTTLLSLITGDSVKGYGEPLFLFGKKKGSGENVWEIKKHIGYVTPNMTDIFKTRHTLQQMILGGLYDSIGLYFIPTELHIQLTEHWLGIVQMQHLKNHLFQSLSNGQQRIALIIRAMVKHPPLLILDEPVFGLDDLNAAMVASFINHIAEKGNSSIVYVSHRKEANLKPQFVYKLIPTENGSIGVKV